MFAKLTIIKKIGKKKRKYSSCHTCSYVHVILKIFAASIQKITLHKVVAYNFGGAFLQAFWLFFKLFSFFKLFCPLTFPHFLLFFRMNLSILFSSSFHLLPLSLPPSFPPSLPSPFFPPSLASTLPLSSSLSISLFSSPLLFLCR